MRVATVVAVAKTIHKGWTLPGGIYTAIVVIVIVFVVWRAWHGSRRQVCNAMATAIAQVRASVAAAAVANATASNTVTVNVGQGAGAVFGYVDPSGRFRPIEDQKAGTAAVEAADRWLDELEANVKTVQGELGPSQVDRLAAMVKRPR